MDTFLVTSFHTLLCRVKIVVISFTAPVDEGLAVASVAVIVVFLHGRFTGSRLTGLAAHVGLKVKKIVIM